MFSESNFKLKNYIAGIVVSHNSVNDFENAKLEGTCIDYNVYTNFDIDKFCCTILFICIYIHIYSYLRRQVLAGKL